MLDIDQASDCTEAVARFNARLGAHTPHHIQVRLAGDGGMARLCEVEAALTDLWATETSKELVWLNRDRQDGADQLSLQAFASDGMVLCTASYRLTRLGA